MARAFALEPRNRLTGGAGSGDYEGMLGALRFSVGLLVSVGLGACSSAESAKPQAGDAGQGAINGQAPSGGDSAGSSSGGSPSSSTAGGTATALAGSTSSSGGGGTHAGDADRGGAHNGGSSQAGASPAGGASADAGPITCRAKGDGKSTITLVNHCTGTLSFNGSGIDGGNLAPGEHACRDVGNATESIPAIRFWGYIGQDPGPERYTLAELTLNTTFNDFDWYNISHVDASNLPMQLSAVDMDKCRTLTCAKSLLAGCPAVGQEKDKVGNVISCFSPDKNNPNSPVAQYFDMACPDAYSWSGDDKDSVVACAGEDYDVVFCP